ncbi:MAG: fused DNA polymerase IV/DNA polymerase III subunit alpha, partial [Terrimicrobiaceae bacterium]
SLEKMCGCRDIDTLIAIVSVIRPGAANTLRKATFARRALGLEKASYPHPSLEPVLRTTHGVIAYEEHILQIAGAFAGMSAGRADILRRALVKVQEAKIEEMRLEFRDCALRYGRSEEEILPVWELIHGFRGYAFCRAHSTAYALEAWQAAWMKTYHPTDFLAAVLTHGKGFYSPLAYSLECRLLGIGFLPPDVNRRQAAFVPEGPATIRVPLTAIKGLSQRLLKILTAEIEARDGGQDARAPVCKYAIFASIADFACKTNSTEVDLRLLLRSGAFDSLCSTRTEGLWKIRKFIVQGADMQTFDHFNTSESLPSLDRLKDEMELLGFTVSGHPLELWPEVAWETYCPIKNIANHSGRRVTICGLIIADRQHHQNDGQPMKFLSICDHTGILETEMFAVTFRKFGLETLRHPVLEITGTVIPFDGDRGHSLRIESVKRPRRKGVGRVAGGMQGADLVDRKGGPGT